MTVMFLFLLFLSIFLENLFERYFLLGFPFLSSSIRIGYVSPPLSTTSHATLHLSAWDDLLLTYSNFLILKFEK